MSEAYPLQEFPSSGSGFADNVFFTAIKHETIAIAGGVHYFLCTVIIFDTRDVLCLRVRGCVGLSPGIISASSILWNAAKQNNILSTAPHRRRL